MSGVSRDVIFGIKDRANVALQNEQLTRQRVEMLETVLTNVRTQVVVQHEILNRSFLGRLHWLLVGLRGGR